MPKKPDNIVFNNEEGYNAKLLPYGTNLGAPIIKIDDLVTWKTVGIQKVNKEIESRFNELKAEYNKLLEEYNWNERIYNAKFSFEPVVGEIYYIYEGKDGVEFLSLIAPQAWKQTYIATLQLDSSKKWVVLDKAENQTMEI